MAKKQNSNKDKSKLDLGKFFKGLFKSQKPKKTKGAPAPKEAETGPVEEAPAEAKPKERPKPVTTSTITLPREQRIFQTVAIVGPNSGALKNMLHILLRRGYETDHILLQTTKRGTYVKHEMDRPLPPGCECIILFEPDSIEQAKAVIEELRKKGPIPMVVISRQFSNATWATEILKAYELSDRFLIRFSFTGLQKIFRRISSLPLPPAQAEAAPPPKPPKPPKAPEESSQHRLVEVPLPPTASAGQPESLLVEEESENAFETSVDVIAEKTQRPMDELASLADEPMVQYRVKGCAKEGIDPERILTRREFEQLFHPGFQRYWNITRYQDSKAMPPVLIEILKLTEEPEPSRNQLAPSESRPAQPAEAASGSSERAPAASPKQSMDLSVSIKEVRKWWQGGRTNKLYTEMETLRTDLPLSESFDREQFTRRLIPLVEGTILFAKGRLDRTVETTLEELFMEDFSRNGLRAPLRLIAMGLSGLNDAYTQSFEQAQQAIVGILETLIPTRGERDHFDATTEKVIASLRQLDELVEYIFSAEKVVPTRIFDYFEKLQKITLDLHESFLVIDPKMLIFGRLDKVIVRSQTRSDWAFDHSEDSLEWQDRLMKFLHFLAEIRIETFRIRQEIELLKLMADQGLPQAVAKVGKEPYRQASTGKPMQRIDKEHLQEPAAETVWHISRHQGNYLIDLYREDDPGIKAFATFDEESITYTWLGIYSGPAENIEENADQESDVEEESEEPGELDPDAP